jgi:hypothetical protein
VKPQRQGQGGRGKGGQEQLKADLAEGLDQPAQRPTGNPDGVVQEREQLQRSRADGSLQR